MNSSAEKEIRAFYTNESIRVYQAFNNQIADSALKYQAFVSPPFKIQRTTWIKPSFLWMMYRSGWATKENQERVLAIDITHEGFLWSLKSSCLSHFDKNKYSTIDNWRKIKALSPVVVQWDPERDILMNKLNHRTIQIGLKPDASSLYVSQWIITIHDSTEAVNKIKRHVDRKELAEANILLPIEKRYTISEEIKQNIAIFE